MPGFVIVAMRVPRAARPGGFVTGADPVNSPGKIMCMDRHTRTALELARSAFGEVRLAEVSILRDGRHRWVQRLKLVTGSGVRSVIAKTCQARERIALELLTEVAARDVPRLLAVCDDPLVVLLDDVGSGSSVADHLLGGHSEGAARAVELWATTLARVHAGGLALGSEFQRRLETDASRARTTGTGDRYRSRFGQDRAVGWKVAVASPDSDPVISDAFRGLRDGLAPLNVPVPDRALEELRAIAARLQVNPASSNGPGALSPCDVCPDNNVVTPDRVVLVDFECAAFRHIAWDAAYLTVPWPSCWCSWRIPEPVSAKALVRWRTAIEPALSPDVTISLDNAVRDATACWALITTAWFLGSAHRDQPLGPGGSLRPGPRQLVQHRLGVAASLLPGELGAIAAQALQATRAPWGDQPLPPAICWRGQTGS